MKLIYSNYAHCLFLWRVPQHPAPPTLLCLNLLVQINATKSLLINVLWLFNFWQGWRLDAAACRGLSLLNPCQGSADVILLSLA